MINQTFSRLMLSLVLLTFVALYAHGNWMTRTWRIDKSDSAVITSTDDRSEGGKSVSRLSKDAQGLHLQCEIEQGYQWPFCEIAIRFSNESNGVNLEQFESIRLKLKSSGPEDTNQVRIFIRNFDPAYSTQGLDASLKPHEVVLNPKLSSTAIELKLNQFMVASWWVQEHPTSTEHIGPELDNVVGMSFTTGGNVKPGHHRIDVESIELIGLWVSPASFRLGIIFVWVGAILTFLLWAWRQSKDELQQSDQLREQLRTTNEALEERVELRTRALAQSNFRLIESLQNLESARNELVQNEKNAALGALVAGIAHELNTPIGNSLLVSSTLIDMIASLEKDSQHKLTRKALNDFFFEAKQGSAILQQNLMRAGTLINSFKQLSADQHSEQRRSFFLLDLVQETSLAMMPKLQTTKHSLHIDIDKIIKMNSYPGPLSQVLINFINNSLTHAFEDIEKGHMFLIAKLIDSDRLELVFSDDGRGIPANILSRVFEPFFTTKLGKGGSGLGMHLAQTIITKMLGGKIEISSVPNEGTSIKLTLPLVAPSEDENTIRIGAPKDVIDDYRHFLCDRDIVEIEHFDGPHSRRDVTELAIFLRTVKRVLPDLKVELVEVDSYRHSIEQLRSGGLTAIGTTAWEADLLTYAEEIRISDAILRDGEFLIGAFTTATNLYALACENINDFTKLKIASNRDWSADWNTLNSIGVENCIDVKTWRQMVYLVSSNEADLLLAPFPKTNDMHLDFDNCLLVPVSNLRIALNGSRHYAVTKNRLGQVVSEAVFPELNRLVKSDAMKTAMSECGFFNEQTSTWKVINERQINTIDFVQNQSETSHGGDIFFE